MNRMMKRFAVFANVLLVGLLFVPAGFSQVDPEFALRAAMETETVEGDLKSAIEQYQEIAASSDRAIAVKALVRMAGCYEKLGVAQARVIYEQVIRDYADQPDSVATAQARLETLRTAIVDEERLALRQVWLDEGGPWVNGTVSSDGRFLSFTDWSSCVPGAEGPCRGELAVRHLDSGTNQVLTDLRHDPGSWVDASAVSPDGSQVAYAWVDTESWEVVVQILPIGGGATPRTVRRDSAVLWPRAWTPDGLGLLVTRTQKEEPWQIGILSIENGAFEEIKSLNFGRIDVSMSPDGRYIAYDTPVGEGPARDIFVVDLGSGDELAVVRHPADDHSTAWSPDGKQLLFLSDRTAVPSLWAIAVREGRPAGEPILLKSDIGDVRPLGVTRAGTLYFSAKQGQRNVYRVSLGPDGRVDGSPSVLTDRFVNANWGASLSPDGKRVAYYSERPETVLVVQDLGSGRESVFPLELDVLRLYGSGPGWLPDGKAILVAARHNERPRPFLSKVNLETGEIREAAGEIGAGFKEAPDGRSVYYQDKGSTQLVRLDLATGVETVIEERDGVIGDKEGFYNPAVSPDGRQLAYLHKTAGEELLLLVKDLGSGETRELLRDSRVNGGSRFNSLEWTTDQSALLYVREDEHGQSIWSIPADGGEAVQIGVTMEAAIKAPQMQPDGKTIIFTVAKRDLVEVWALSNFLPEP
ncbi:MAG: PD40 domain-containing protein [Acidobacteriota bacterium]|nr:MAG: PD40 domain-containing protein [Acidobacteriota bacterium]